MPIQKIVDFFKLDLLPDALQDEARALVFVNNGVNGPIPYQTFFPTPQPPGPSKLQIITGRGYVNLSSDGYCGPDGTDMLSGFNQAVQDIQTNGRGQGLLITGGTWTTSAPLVAGMSTNRVMIDGYEGQTIITSNTATLPFNITASQTGTTVTVSANPSGKRIGVNTNLRPSAGGVACTVLRVLGPNTYSVNFSQNVASTTFAANNPLMLIGGSDPLPNGYMSGHVHGIKLVGASSAPSDMSVGLGIASYLSMRLHHIEVANFDIGFDTLNNTFGLDVSQIWAGQGGSCNVGFNVRGGGEIGAGAGNQVKIENAWLTGMKSGMSVGPGTDGLLVAGGQIGALGTTDDCAAFVLCKDYLTGQTQGIGPTDIKVVDFESFNGWVIRSYDQFSVKMSSCSIIGNNTPKGILHATNDRNSNLNLDSNSFTGIFSSPTAIVRDGASYDGAQYFEVSSKVDGLSFNGVAVLNQTPLVKQSGMTKAVAIYNDYGVGPAIYANGATIPFSALAQFAIAPIDPLNAPYKASFLDAQTIQGSIDGTALTNIADSAGTGSPFTQGTTSLAPTYRDLYSSVRLPNARPVILFDGVDDYLSNADSASGAQTVFIVAKLTNTSNTQAFIGSNASGGLAFRIQPGNQLAMEADGIAGIGVAFPPALDTTKYHVFVCAFISPGLWSIWYDGVKLNSGTTSTTLTASRTRTIGRQAGGSFFAGPIAGVYSFSANLSDTNIMGISAFLKQQFGTA